MDIWIYRPDYEAAARKINRNFVFNGRGKAYFDVLEQRNALKKQYSELLEKKRKDAADVKIEVPHG